MPPCLPAEGWGGVEVEHGGVDAVDVQHPGEGQAAETGADDGDGVVVGHALSPPRTHPDRRLITTHRVGHRQQRTDALVRLDQRGRGAGQ
jgi:hypothetical protein